MSDDRRRRRLTASDDRRRRRLLVLGCLAAASLAVGAVVGSSGGDAGAGDAAEAAAGEDARPGGDAEEDARRGGEAEQAAAEVPTVTGFEGPVPILMYHAVEPPPPGTAYPDLFTLPGELRAQLRWLARRGYHAVTLDELFAAWEDGEPIAEKPVVLSFDDGLRSQYVEAFPLLEEMGWAGVLNLKVESLDQGELTEEMVGEMVEAGWAVDSHTLTHPDVTTLDAAALRREVAGSRRELRRRLGVPVNFFSYPAGAYDEAAIAAVRSAGYKGAVTTEPGLATPGDPYRLKRVRIDGGDGAAGLEQKLAAAQG